MKAPNAVAGYNQRVASGEAVFLDGIGASDRDGTIEKYLWERVDGSSSRMNLFTDPDDDSPTNYVLGLTGPAGPKLRNRTHFGTYCERGLYSEGFSLKFRCELRDGGYFDGEYWP